MNCRGLVVISLISISLTSISSFGQRSDLRKEDEFGWSLKQYEGKKKLSKNEEKQVGQSDEGTIQIETDLAVSDVLVTNQNGSIIKGLKRDDFLVVEDGVPQKIELFSFGQDVNLPKSIVLLLDQGIPQGPLFEESIRASKTLVETLAPEDRMAIVTNDLKVRVHFTKDKELLKSTLDSLTAKGEWNIEFTTLLAVLNELFDEGDRRRIIIFQGDGNHAIWLKPDKDTPYPVSHSTMERIGKYTRRENLPKFGFSDIKRTIEGSGATIYSVIPGLRFYGLSKDEQLARAKITLAGLNKHYGWQKERDMPLIIRHFQQSEAETKTAGQTAMFRIAELSGGFADFIEKPEDAHNVYSNIFTVMSNRYSIAYYPSNQKRDGKRREVRIEVKGRPEFKVTARMGYYYR